MFSIFTGIQRQRLRKEREDDDARNALTMLFATIAVFGWMCRPSSSPICSPICSRLLAGPISAPRRLPDGGRSLARRSDAASSRARRRRHLTDRPNPLGRSTRSYPGFTQPSQRWFTMPPSAPGWRAFRESESPRSRRCPFASRQRDRLFSPCILPRCACVCVRPSPARTFGRSLSLSSSILSRSANLPLNLPFR